MLTVSEQAKKLGVDPSEVPTPPWETCSGPSLRGHLLNQHLLNPVDIQLSGVPRFEIEVAAARDISLDWVVRKVVEFLEKGDVALAKLLEEYHMEGDESVQSYRAHLLKCLRYIEQIGCATVPWTRLDALVPNASEVEVDIDRDSLELPLETTVRDYVLGSTY